MRTTPASCRPATIAKSRRAVEHGLAGVPDQVDQDLLDLRPVSENPDAGRPGIDPRHDTLLAGFDQGEIAGLANEPRHAFGAPLRLASGHEVA